MNNAALVFFYFYLTSLHYTYVLDVKDVLITVKTTHKHEKLRLKIILDTWFQLAKDQIWFFTDIGYPAESFAYLQNITKKHMVVTQCGNTHDKVDLCCKTSNQLNFNLSTADTAKWLCLFDDDNYVNVPKLVEELQKYNHSHYWYLGRKFLRGNHSAITKASEFKDRKGILSYIFTYHKRGKWSKFYYGTLGAGVCLSKALLEEIRLYLSFRSLVKLCDWIEMADDISLGYLIEARLGVRITDVPRLHSHLENLTDIRPEVLKDQISLSYNLDPINVINVSGFDKEQDPTRFYSLHCFLGYCSDKLSEMFTTTPSQKHSEKAENWNT